MRLGVLGGSFNPPHIGHLVVASDAHEALKLDRLLIVPAFANPLKPTDGRSPLPEQRLEMVRRAFGGDPRFEVSAMEIERGGLSYMVDTLEGLAAQNAGAELTLLVGLDSFRTMDRWKRPERIRELARIAVLTRRQDHDGQRRDDVNLQSGVTIVTARRIDVSSSEIRERLAAGKSIRGFVAESVEAFISAAKLYRSPAAAG
ncbi:MAG: nicotinate (nicotinamide) nucleotide adenylyltransferase [Gemmatimonadaceae bacterium]|nr:nicotinate (nicotinamide) nucleotide adenylyltransferase [Gemmatimonadaceae bacterium]